MADTRTTYSFGEFRLDPAGAWLRRGKQEVDLSPRAFQVLAYLIEHRERVISKQDLIEAVWKNTFVTDDALVQAITAIRRALGDSADQPRYIRTRPRVGYQFIAEVDDGMAPAAADPPSKPVSVWVAPVRRETARLLVGLIQVGYLVVYSITLLELERASAFLGTILERMGGPGGLALPFLVVLALIGMAVRLYLIAAVALDHPETGRQFKRLFPAVFLLDEIWACVPLIMVETYGLPVALALIPILAYAPFSQLTMIRSAYGPRSSAV